MSKMHIALIEELEAERDEWKADYLACEDERRKLAARVAELEAELEAISRQLRREGYFALADRIAALAAGKETA